MKTLKHLNSLVFFMALAINLNAQKLLNHDFNNGQFGPYEVNKSNQESRVYIKNGAVETRWLESSYDGTNSGRKAQFRPDNFPDYRFTQEFWTGFKLKVHSDYMSRNTNTDASLLQIWGNNDNGAANHMCMLKFDGRNGGALTWQHRFNSVANKDHYLIYPKFPRDRFVDIIIRIDLSINGSTVQVWVDGELRLNRSGERFGWGDMNANGFINRTYGTMSYGQYNFRENASFDETYDKANHLYDGHMRGETRTVTYDNLSAWNGTNGYDRVNPSGGGSSSASNTSDGTIVQIRKRNATGFAFDGGNGGENGQNVYIWSQNANNKNQQWVEIDRGNGFYSYQKQGTNFCIDGNRGGENGQNTYLWTCSTSNQNQHWKKVSTAGGSFRLEKRNSSNYSLDGGPGGENGQNVYLWASNNNNQNQQWLITPVGSAKSVVTTVATDDVIIYPNPVVSTATIQGAANTTISVYDISGQVLLEKQIITDSEEIDLTTLPPGVYYGQVIGGQSISTMKIVK